MLRKCLQLLQLLAFFVNSQKVIPGHCPPVTPQKGLDRDRLLGVWYQQATFKPLLKDEATCTHFLFRQGASGAFRVEVRKVGKLIGGPASVYGLAKPMKKAPGSFKVTFYGELVNEASTYYILHTDYSGVAVVWSCDTFYSLWTMQNVQVLTRARSVNTTDLLVSALKALLPHRLDKLLDFLNPVDQSQCEEILAK